MDPITLLIQLGTIVGVLVIMAVTAAFAAAVAIGRAERAGIDAGDEDPPHDLGELPPLPARQPGAATPRDALGEGLRLAAGAPAAPRLQAGAGDWPPHRPDGSGRADGRQRRGRGCRAGAEEAGMTDTTTPTLAEQAAWMREIVGYLTRQYATLVETGRLTREEADRRKRLGAACLETLEMARYAAPVTSSGARTAASLASQGKPVLLVQLTCGTAGHEDMALNPGLLIENPLVLSTFAHTIERRVLAVVRQGLGRSP